MSIRYAPIQSLHIARVIEPQFKNFVSGTKARTQVSNLFCNKQREGGGEIRRRVHIMRLKVDEIYGIINAARLAGASLGLRPLHTLCACVIDGFAKMSLQANIFASWYNKVSKIRR